MSLSDSSPDILIIDLVDSLPNRDASCLFFFGRLKCMLVEALFVKFCLSCLAEDNEPCPIHACTCAHTRRPFIRVKSSVRQFLPATTPGKC